MLGGAPDSDALWESPGAVATKDHRTAGLKTTNIYSLTLLGAGGLQSRCQQGPFSLQILWSLAALGVPWLADTSFQSLLPSPRDFSPRCLSVPES